MDAPESLKTETNAETANRTMILPVLNSQKKMSILYPKNVVSTNSGPSNAGWWKMNGKLTGFRSVNSKGSGKETNKEFYVGIIRCSNCNTTNTTLWRKFGDTGEYGCNSCVLYWKVNGVSLFHVRNIKGYYQFESRDLLLSTIETPTHLGSAHAILKNRKNFKIEFPGNWNKNLVFPDSS